MAIRPPRCSIPGLMLRSFRWKRWGEMGVFVRVMEAPATADAEPKIVIIDATHLYAHGAEPTG